MAPMLVFGQNGYDSLRSPYHINYSYELPLTLVGAGTAAYGYSRLGANTTLDEDDFLEISSDRINAFDRVVLNIPEGNYETAKKASDHGLYASISAPLLLLLDKESRDNVGQIGLMYLESQALTSLFYQGVAYSIEKPRPLVYNTNLSFEERTGHHTSNSFFSGHTASAATGTFFTAKVFCDLNDLSRGEKVLVYGLASIPPAIVGHNRIRAGKHFRTDVMTGYALGALIGIAIPELHKNEHRKVNVIPVYSNEIRGFSLRLNL